MYTHFYMPFVLVAVAASVAFYGTTAAIMLATPALTKARRR